MAKVTKIETQKRNKERVNIYIDNVYSFSASLELIYKEHLKVNEEVHEERLRKIAKEENLCRCKDTALRIVERSYKTEKEMKDRLLEKGYDEETVIAVLGFLKEYKFINDEAYAKMYTKDRMRSQGSQKIKYDLKKKGIDEEKIEETLNSFNEEDEKMAAMELAEKKYKQLIKRENDKYKLWNKLCRFLVSRGYNYGLSKEVVKKILSVDETY